MNDPKAKRRVAAKKRCTKNIELKHQRRPRLLKSLRLFYLVQFVKCCQFFSGAEHLKTATKIRIRKSK